MQPKGDIQNPSCTRMHDHEFSGHPDACLSGSHSYVVQGVLYSSWLCQI